MHISSFRIWWICQWLSIALASMVRQIEFVNLMPNQLWNMRLNKRILFYTKLSFLNRTKNQFLAHLERATVSFVTNSRSLPFSCNIYMRITWIFFYSVVIEWSWVCVWPIRIFVDSLIVRTDYFHKKKFIIHNADTQYGFNTMLDRLISDSTLGHMCAISFTWVSLLFFCSQNQRKKIYIRN